MFKIVGLDLANTTGYAILAESKLTGYGVLNSTHPAETFRCHDYTYIERAKSLSRLCKELIIKESPDLIVIEQTNKSKSRFTQKQLEFIHYAVLEDLREYRDKIIYIDTSAWRTGLSLNATKEDRKHNALVKKKLARGKITPKHRSVRWANETFDLTLKLKDNDIADAIALVAFAAKRQGRLSQVNAISSITDFFEEET